MCRKPLNTFQNSSDFELLFVSLLKQIKKELCQFQSFATTAEKNLKLNQKEQSEALSIAQWIAEENINIQADLNVLMDTLQSLTTENTSLNTVLSWLNILEEIYRAMNISITETQTKLITELKILKSLEWVNIFQNIMQAKKTNQNGLNAVVYDAESLFNVLRLKLQDIHSLIAQESALSVQLDQKTNMELFTLCRKPLEEKTIAKNVLKHGTGGINIDGCRVETNETITNHSRSSVSSMSKGKYGDSSKQDTYQTEGQINGRFLANFIHDGSDEVVSKFPNSKSTGGKGSKSMGALGDSKYGKYNKQLGQNAGGLGDSGSASRFFYTAKASKSERNKGLEGFTEKKIENHSATFKNRMQSGVKTNERSDKVRANNHPTVKPIKLMKYLCRLITPVNGVVLDPYMGSGSTGIAAKEEGFNFTGIELDEDYFEIAKARINSKEDRNPTLFDA